MSALTQKPYLNVAVKLLLGAPGVTMVCDCAPPSDQALKVRVVVPLV